MIWQLSGGRTLEFDSRTQIMGVLNVTPDSFFDGGMYDDPVVAAQRALEMVDEGADVIDVGAESSRPPVYGGWAPVPEEEELARLIPAIEAIRRESQIPLSVDTVKAEVARRALGAGADIINDISAMQDDGNMALVAVDVDCPVILMHRRGTPDTMQKDTHYDDVVGEVSAFLEDRVLSAIDAGIDATRIGTDPGIGFGKSVKGNHELLRHCHRFRVNDTVPVFVGASRKSFTWRPLGLSPEEALEGSLAAAVVAVLHGASALRVHDVAATVRAIAVAEAQPRLPALQLKRETT